MISIPSRAIEALSRLKSDGDFVEFIDFIKAAHKASIDDMATNATVAGIYRAQGAYDVLNTILEQI